MDPLNPNVPSPGPVTIASSGDNVWSHLSPHRLIGVLFLVSQVIFILQTYFVPENSRRLSPVEGLTRYELRATLAGRTLSASEIEDRYGIAPQDDVTLTVGALRAAITHRETHDPASGDLYVRLRTREPNGTEEYWLWPQD
jgi:hypothetical protein